MAANENDSLFKKNRRAVKEYLLWRDQRNREEAEDEEPEEISEYRLEINSLTHK